MKTVFAAAIAFALVATFCAFPAHGVPVFSKKFDAKTARLMQGGGDDHGGIRVGLNWDTPCMIEEEDASRPLLRKLGANWNAPRSSGGAHEEEKSEPVLCARTHKRDAPKSSEVESV